jgi:hypothetical protein
VTRRRIVPIALTPLAATPLWERAFDGARPPAQHQNQPIRWLVVALPTPPRPNTAA